jgi:E3 ubiquitin-protein ligase SHPRH
MEDANTIIGELLNAQANLLWDWRRQIYDLLTQKISSGEEDATGQEYSKSIEFQGRADVLLRAYAALMADRREVLVAERTTLATLDNREVKARRTKAARQAEEARDMMDVEAPLDLQGLPPLEPEYQVLAKELSDQRQALMQNFDGRAVKTFMVQLNEVVGGILCKVLTSRWLKSLAQFAPKRATQRKSLLGMELNASVLSFVPRVWSPHYLREPFSLVD